MISVLALIGGVVLGALGGALHLSVTWLRARQAVAGSSSWLVSYPLGLIGPVLAVLTATAIAYEAAFGVLVGTFAVRWWVLGRLRERGHS